ncbi:ABC transporter [Aeromicrobium camelliae]|uniref:ABC transporter n=1 Tax=Aeromicrobium camelliae TaxID=1538144 RepID=A0A3N6WTH8_9ACTN|nr:dynamin family protein [Aeromicrobium camelliae]RQN08332.1 ABC transporter [Aeromicrobium camelliae]
MASSDPGVQELLTATQDLLAAVRTAPLRLQTPRLEHARAIQREVTDQLSDFVIPRLTQLDAPMLVVVGGSTGAGKSTLVNSIVGRHVSDTGVLRPTTRTPVLVHHPDDAAWFASNRVLPDLKRTGENPHEVYALRQVSSPTIPAGLAILDAPDIDSIDVGNRELAEQLLAAADLWLFVTSAARYADHVPWDYLRRAAERSASVAVVLDRTPADAVEDVRRHLARMMTARGLSDSPLFTVRESSVNRRGMLPFDEVGQIVLWLQELAADVVGRRTIVAATLHGAIRHDVFRSRDLADEIEEQAEAAEALVHDVDTIYRRAVEEVASAATDGTVLRGEVLARWQAFVGTGEVLRRLEQTVGSWRDRVAARAVRQVDPQTVGSAIGQGLHLLLVEQAERAAEETARAWESEPAGRALLDEHRGLDRASRELAARAERLAREWQEFVQGLVAEEGEGKKARATAVSTGVNATGIALMVAVFAGTGGITGAEVGIAGGTAVVAQKLLQAVFGDQAVRDLADRAAADLSARFEALFAEEADRFRRLVPEPKSVRAAQRDLRKVANRADVVRLATDIRRPTIQQEGV